MDFCAHMNQECRHSTESGAKTKIWIIVLLHLGQFETNKIAGIYLNCKKFKTIMTRGWNNSAAAFKESWDFSLNNYIAVTNNFSPSLSISFQIKLPLAHFFVLF